LSNTGTAPDELVEAATPIAAKIEFRANSDYSKQPLSSIIIEAGKPVPMRLKALHLRLLGLKKPIVEYETFPLTLTFKNAGKIDIEIEVEAPQ
jgi:copper(I)-binding protein